MTFYNVHIYREMRLYYPGIEADTPGDAARLAASRHTEDAEDISDCDGETFAALVDVVGDDRFCQTVLIDFESESDLATALRRAIAALNQVPSFRTNEGITSYQLLPQLEAILRQSTTTPANGKDSV